MNLLPLWDLVRLAEWGGFWVALREVPLVPDFWLWLYLAFTISSTMMPSASDRQAWLPVGVLILLLVPTAVLAGAGPWMLANLAPPVNRFMQSLALIFGLSSAIHVLFLFPFFLLHKAAAKLSRLDVG
jgi:hypothetical protein